MSALRVAGSRLRVGVVLADLVVLLVHDVLDAAVAYFRAPRRDPPRSHTEELDRAVDLAEGLTAADGSA